MPHQMPRSHLCTINVAT